MSFQDDLENPKLYKKIQRPPEYIKIGNVDDDEKSSKSKNTNNVLREEPLGLPVMNFGDEKKASTKKPKQQKVNSYRGEAPLEIPKVFEETSGSIRNVPQRTTHLELEAPLEIRR